MRRFGFWILIAGIVTFIAMSAIEYLGRPGPGDEAPAFSLNSLDDKVLTLDDFKGRPILLHFWATWCGLCQREVPSLVRLQREFGDSDLAIIALSEDASEDREIVRSFVDAMGFNFPVLLDEGGAVADLYRSWTVPESILIDRSGVIVWRHAGLVDWDDEKIRSLVR